MCCVMKMGREIFLVMPPSASISALGPPVDEPIASASGKLLGSGMG